MNSLSLRNAICKRMRSQFSAYIDGELSGRTMNALATHMDRCPECRAEFATWRAMSDTLASAGRFQPPADLQLRLQTALHTERLEGTHLPAPRRFALLWDRTVAPLLRETIGPVAARATAGLVVAASLLGGLTWMFSGPLSVEANDERMAHLSAPSYMYAQAPLDPVVAKNDAPILVEASVDSQGRVYDFRIVEGPSDPTLRLQIEKNLVVSLFHPATLFGEPVNGHVMLTYTGVNVRG